jgi:localization factor PodJL
MSQQGTAAAGRKGTGSDEGAPWESGAAVNARDGMPEAGPAGEEGVSAFFGDGQSEAETRLYEYLDQLSAPQSHSGFRPLEELNARLNEQPYRDSLLFPHSEEEVEAPEPPAPNGVTYRDDLHWFDHRFGELKRLLQDEGKRERVEINSRLAEIQARLERLSAAMPNGKTFASVETKLTALSRSLDETRAQAAADAGRISRAAKEILTASSLVQEAPARLEAAARQTVDGLTRTVAVASRAAALTAASVAALPKPETQKSAIERLEAELRALNKQSRESGERTATALDRLRDFLERGQGGQGPSAFQAPRRRASVHEPISGNSAVYTPGDTGFGAAPAPEPRLDTLLLRNPRPSDPNFYEALREAGERHGKKKAADAPETGAEKRQASPVASAGTSFLRDEDKGTPLAGIAAVAFILLLVSAALFYLHMRSGTPPLHATASAAAKAELAAPAKSSSRAALELTPRGTQQSPALFSASDQDRAGAKPDSPSEDLELLEAAARQGDKDAQFRIAVRFLNEGSPEASAATAARWLARAADQGHIEAQFMLASLFERGAGVARDEEQAIALYRKAANAGHVRAMHNLGVLLSARASPQNYREAASWFDRAAHADLADSQYNLALLYERGLGIEQDLSRAYFWYSVAAKAGDKEAARQAERLKRSMSPAGTASEAEQAGSWKPVIEDGAKSAGMGSGAKG